MACAWHTIGRHWGSVTLPSGRCLTIHRAHSSPATHNTFLCGTSHDRLDARTVGGHHRTQKQRCLHWWKKTTRYLAVGLFCIKVLEKAERMREDAAPRSSRTSTHAVYVHYHSAPIYKIRSYMKHFIQNLFLLKSGQRGSRIGVQGATISS